MGSKQVVVKSKMCRNQNQLLNIVRMNMKKVAMMRNIMIKWMDLLPSSKKRPLILRSLTSKIQPRKSPILQIPEMSPTQALSIDS
jgi:hypothetical protein